MPKFWVYILASKRNGTLYTGRTETLDQRIQGHKGKQSRKSFTARYDVLQLVWYEGHESFETARQRELAIKRWRRAWKLQLIEIMNPDWRDLAASLNGHS